jgi:type VI secretion system protein VasD
VSNFPMRPARCTAVLAAAAMVFLSACGGPPKPAQVSGTIEASTSVNPSVSRRPSPVTVRVYELKTATAFNSADFVSLYQRDQAELGADLLGREEFTLAPGETRPYTKTLSPDTRFIGVFAAYRDLERAKWRTVLPVQPGKKQRIVIRAEELSVSAAATK